MFRSKGVVVAFAVLSLCAFTAGCGGDDGATEEQLRQAREDGAKEAKAQVKLNQLQRQVNRLAKKNKRDSGNSAQSSGTTSTAAAPATTATSSYTECSFGVKAGPNTSCAFAMNVSGEYGSNPGAGTIQAFSPVTGMDYTMQCGPSGGGTICSGGNGASVFIP
ncbi:MAG TPA: hypothetical protein VMF31_02320 [Solirubrobacterales bacterium]|nr:hypothetical protein [Solirubrobacterales bacterium]